MGLQLIGLTRDLQLFPQVRLPVACQDYDVQ